MRIFLLHEGDHVFAHLAAQVESLAGRLCGAQHPQLHGLFGDVGHLQVEEPPVPLRVARHHLFEGRPQRCHRHAEVDVQKHRTQQLGAGAGPVLERVLDEPLQGNDQPPVVPDLQHDVGAGDLLHAAPFALDDQHVVDTDRLGQGDLQAGDEVAENRLGRQTGDDADDTRRRQQAGPDLLGAGEGHQHHGRARKYHHQHGAARQHPGLGVDAAGLQVVVHIGRVLRNDAGGHAADGADDQPGDGGDQHQPVEMADGQHETHVVACRLPHQLERQHRQQHAGRSLAGSHDGLQHRCVAGGTQQHHGGHAVQQQGQGHHQDGGDHGGDPRG